MVISDAFDVIKAAVSKVFSTTWRRCRAHFMRSVLAHAGKSGRRVVAAFIATAFAQDAAEAARQQWRQVADQLRAKVPKLAALLRLARGFLSAKISAVLLAEQLALRLARGFLSAKIRIGKTHRRRQLRLARGFLSAKISASI